MVSCVSVLLSWLFSSGPIIGFPGLLAREEVCLCTLAICFEEFGCFNFQLEKMRRNGWSRRVECSSAPPLPLDLSRIYYYAGKILYQ
jgi:hypothetical protein